MKAVIQRVTEANVSVEKEVIGEIGKGLMILLGIEEADGKEDLDWLCKKIVNMRIFSDENGNMNTSLLDVQGEILLISQFTLHASTKKGNRPSFIQAARPEKAEELYEEMIQKLQELSGKNIQSGRFGAMMLVELKNEGPVTIILDSKNKV